MQRTSKTRKASSNSLFSALTSFVTLLRCQNARKNPVFFRLVIKASIALRVLVTLSTNFWLECTSRSRHTGSIRQYIWSPLFRPGYMSRQSIDDTPPQSTWLHVQPARSIDPVYLEFPVAWRFSGHSRLDNLSRIPAPSRLTSSQP